jgi:hypothetical protein
MKLRYYLPLASVGLAFCFVAGCGSTPVPQSNVENQVSETRPPQGQIAENAEIQKKIRFNLDKLKDRSYTKTYGEGKPWYTAAEALGEIGKPAIPHLIKKLDSKDPYELKLALYALLLASQDSRVTSLTNGEYVNLVSSLDEKDNAKNKEIALHWWNKYKSRLQPVV